MITLQPLGDRVVIKADPEETGAMTASGLYIPDPAVKKPQAGTILAVGFRQDEEGVKIPLQVQPGDRVYFSMYSGNDLEINGEKFLICRESDLLARVVEE